MTIERRVTFFGIPMKKEKVVPGKDEYISRSPETHGASKPLIRVFVDSEDSLIFIQGFWESGTRGGFYHPDPDSAREVHLVRDQVNRVDVKGESKFGKRVSYKWRETPVTLYQRT